MSQIDPNLSLPRNLITIRFICKCILHHKNTCKLRSFLNQSPQFAILVTSKEMKHAHRTGVLPHVIIIIIVIAMTPNFPNVQSQGWNHHQHKTHTVKAIMGHFIAAFVRICVFIIIIISYCNFIVFFSAAGNCKMLIY